MNFFKKHSRHAWITAAAVLALLVAALVFYLTRHAAHFTLPYHDAFSSNSAQEWEPLGGVWQLNGGTVFNRSDERGAKLITGSSSLSDYKMKADLEMLGDSGDTGVIVRVGQEERGIDSYNGYYIGLRSFDSALIMGRADHGWLEARPVPMPGGVHSLVWYRLVVVAVGCHLAASATNLGTGATAWAAFEETSCVSKGKIGLRSMATGGAWRNISVTRATFQNWADLRAHAAFVGHPIYPILEADYNRMRAVGSLSTESLLASNRSAAAAPGPLPDLVPIDSLRAITTSVRDVRIRGVVTLTDPIYVQDSTGGIAVDLHKPRLLNLGDEIEVVGSPTDSAFAPRLQASAVRLLWDRTLLVPLSISSTQAASGKFDSSLVEVRGFLRSKSRNPDGTVILTIGDESQSFTTVLKHALSLRAYDTWEPGSWLRVHGICVIHQPSAADNSVFTILARSPDDIELLAGPPWWSGERILRLIIPALLLIVVVFILYVRIERWKMRGILNERERLAHDMHDTLAQSFAGVGFHLQGIRNSLRGAAAPGIPGLMEKLDVACELVTQTHREASANIAALHPDADEGSDLLVALEHYVIRMFNPGNSPLVISRHGSPRHFSLPVRDALFQIGREAISNVIRHSHATQIALCLRYEMKWAVLEIRDDGVGFISGESIGFGIKTMRSRSKAVGAELTISSTPGAGTTVSVRSPYGMHLNLVDWIRHIWSRQLRSNRGAPLPGD